MPNKPETSTAMEWMDKISDLMGNADKGLDQVKKSIQSDLEKLRGESNLESLSVNLFQKAEAGFKKDLYELGVPKNAQAEYLKLFKETWEKEEMSKKSKEILNSPELKAMNQFISDMENLPKLKEVIDSAKPRAKWQTLLEKIGIDPEFVRPILSFLGLGWLVGSKEKKEEDETNKDSQSENKKQDETKVIF